MIFKKNKEYSDDQILAPVEGIIFPTKEIPDSMFADELMGSTLAIRPADWKQKIVSPINGTVEALFPTGHAFAIRSKSGIGLLVHIGINTVELKGKYFKKMVKQGDVVKAGQGIVVVDFDGIAKAGYNCSVMMIITENPNSCKVTYKGIINLQIAEMIGNIS